MKLKQSLIGAIVGGIIIFTWQFLSWSLLDMHRSGTQYTPLQDSILHYLETSGLEEGAFFMPGVQPGSSMEDYEKVSEENAGKPWAQLSYHKVNNTDMVMNQIRGLVVNIVIVGLLIWIIGRYSKPTFTTTFFTCLFIGCISFLNSAYTQHIWFQTFDLYAHLVDALVAWSVCGVWLGWWLKRKKG
jgi:hypothetical protein